MRTFLLTAIILLTLTVQADDKANANTPPLAPPIPTPITPPPPFDVKKLSDELGIKPEDFTDCYSYVTPPKKGEEQSEALKIANKQILISCLQLVNPDITDSQLDAVMSKYRS